MSANTHKAEQEYRGAGRHMRCCSSDPQPTSLLCVDFESVGEAATGHVPNAVEDQAGSDLATCNLDLRMSHIPFAGGKLIADAWRLEQGAQFLPNATPDVLATERSLPPPGVIDELLVYRCYTQVYGMKVRQREGEEKEFWLSHVLGSAERTGHRIVAAGARGAEFYEGRVGATVLEDLDHRWQRRLCDIWYGLNDRCHT